MDEFMKAMNFRHACKIFDENKKIPKEDLDYILEAGRMSPSSFGIEQWKFLVIQNQELKEKLKPHCWNQSQITTCSDLIILLAKKNMRSSNEYVQNQFKRWGLPQEKYNGVINLYENFVDIRSDEELNGWSAKQCYIASGNMMTAGAFRGIDSCPIEGFVKEEIEEILNYDRDKYEIAYMIPFGYRVKEQQPRYRLDIDELVEYRK